MGALKRLKRQLRNDIINDYFKSWGMELVPRTPYSAGERKYGHQITPQVHQSDGASFCLSAVLRFVDR